MALTIAGIDRNEGSGEFVHETVWSCPYHDRDANPIADYGDPDPEWEPGEFCNSCRVAGWKKLYNDDGTPRMRELATWETLYRDMTIDLLKNQAQKLKLLDAMGSATSPHIVWCEDSLDKQ